MNIEARPAPATWLRLREEPENVDIAAVRQMVESTGFFSADEVSIAVELVEARLARGLASGYRFLFAEPLEGDDPAVAYTCYGEIPCTVGSYDLYWIAVRDAVRGRRIGHWLLAETEQRIRALHGRQIYIETSGRDLYASTQGFYARCGYELVARLDDFYADGDPKLVYTKRLSPVISD
jgi:ribosomal protein S18 acetylase RimI-like enzyme